MVRHWPWARFYSHAWELASFVVTGLMIYTEYRVNSDKSTLSSISTVFAYSRAILTLIRIAHCVFVLYALIAQSFNPNVYKVFYAIFILFGLIVLSVEILLGFIEGQKVAGSVALCIGAHELLCVVESFFIRILLSYRANTTAETWLEASFFDDFIPTGGLSTFEIKMSIWGSEDHRFHRRFRRCCMTISCTGHVLAETRAGEKHCGSQLTAARSIPSTILVDAWPEFKRQVVAAKVVQGSPLLYDNSVTSLLSDALEAIGKKHSRGFPGDRERQQHDEIPRIIVIIHGIRDFAQAKELYDIIQRLEPQQNQSLHIVVISTPQVLREVSGNRLYITEHVYTLYLAENGRVIYSGRPLALLQINTNLFHLVLDGIFRSAGEVSEQLWAELLDRATSSVFQILDPSDDLNLSTLTMFHLLHEAAEDRKRMLKFLSDLPVVSPSQIYTSTQEDSIKIALMLQTLIQHNSYKDELLNVPEQEALSVLNLTHHILDRGLPENPKIQNEKLFRRRAQRLLNVLVHFLKILPEELVVHRVELLNDRPVKCGGFSDIYHGRYTTYDGEKKDVALKVLKVFQDQSDGDRHLLLQKFAKEALVWHYLKHSNIVPFLGVDEMTFPAPTMAMVSSWMSEGSVLNYMAENSPVSRYAITLLDDVSKGLLYLHSENVVHGDLCGRNILIHERRACLTDFGLAAFVELETSIKTSTRGGSPRWMAPELHLPDVYQPGLPFRRTPASDVWAFGCVCCEIWSEGQIPFAHMSDGVPYTDRPCDKAGAPMPKRLWDLTPSPR
ncbi:Serine/threonine-protein kinase STY8 [Mycena venus]|uniref:Serine/threonine-protein kinase STY8 n=1 Tax=Mycena venus TaxID=2733690 RepID=A0A8H6WTR6_9AGAR|nr:Serine/threonine-protein kinase STY8 [Mycena venus]